MASACVGHTKNAPDAARTFYGPRTPRLDTIAVGVLRALTERGLRVPQDIALAGFDDLPIASMLTPSLTTVRHDPSQHAALAADMLVRQIHRKAVTERQVEIAPELVIRESCGRLSD
ncbi:substrate-binding domain-containing protein [Ensifer sp. NPDC090286]|uniref:substrate-binding domain-containing protein n=1 Tax=Ensifer sp. NPDC090286 TaxID=3363991 RepID=UPI00383AFE0E